MPTPTTPAAQTALKKKLLALPEFTDCTFAKEARLYSYQQKKHLEFGALLLNSLNAPVLIITEDAKNHRILLKDYPVLKYIIALDPRDALSARVLTQGKGESFPLEVLLAEAPPEDRTRPAARDTNLQRAAQRAAQDTAHDTARNQQTAARALRGAANESGHESAQPRETSARSKRSTSLLQAGLFLGALAGAFAIIMLLLVLLR